MPKPIVQLKSWGRQGDFLSLRPRIEAILVLLALLLAHPSTLSLKSGLAISCLGLLLRAISTGYGNKKGVTSHRFLRHPYFTGSFLLVMGGVVAALNTPLFLLAIPVLSCLYAFEASSEEKAFASPSLRDYRHEVPAFVPQLTSYNQGVNRFSLRDALLSEPIATIGVFASYLYLKYLSQLSWAPLGLLMVATACAGFKVIRLKFFKPQSYPGF